MKTPQRAPSLKKQKTWLGTKIQPYTVPLPLRNLQVINKDPKLGGFRFTQPSNYLRIPFYAAIARTPSSSTELRIIPWDDNQYDFVYPAISQTLFGHIFTIRQIKKVRDNKFYQGSLFHTQHCLNLSNTIQMFDLHLRPAQRVIGLSYPFALIIGIALIPIVTLAYIAMLYFGWPSKTSFYLQLGYSWLILLPIILVITCIIFSISFMRKRDDIKTIQRLKQVQWACDSLNKHLNKKGFNFRPGDYGAWIEISLKAAIIERQMNYSRSNLNKIDQFNKNYAQYLESEPDNQDQLEKEQKNIENLEKKKNQRPPSGILKSSLRLPSDTKKKMKQYESKNLPKIQEIETKRQKPELYDVDNLEISHVISSPILEVEKIATPFNENKLPFVNYSPGAPIIENTELVFSPPPNSKVINSNYFEMRNKANEHNFPIQESIPKDSNQQSEMSAKQKRFYDRFKKFKQEKNEKNSKINERKKSGKQLNRGLEAHYDSIIPRSEVVYDPNKSINLMLPSNNHK